jgi:hypothetical protein
MMVLPPYNICISTHAAKPQPTEFQLGVVTLEPRVVMLRVRIFEAVAVVSDIVQAF